MEDVFALLITRFEVFLPVLVRISAIFIITPIFGRRNIPALFKVGFAFMLSLILINVLEAEAGLFKGFIQYALLIAGELMVGFFIGFVTYIIFTSIYIAGQIIDMEIGFGVVNVLDPQSNIQVPIMGNFLYIMALLIFISIDGHHMLISALFKSFEMVPLGKVSMTADAVGDLVRIFGDTFLIGFKISTPVIAAVLLTDVSLGILARTMPQMNVFMVGIPLKIIVGMCTLLVMLPVFPIVLDVMFNNMAEGILRALSHLR